MPLKFLKLILAGALLTGAFNPSYGDVISAIADGPGTNGFGNLPSIGFTFTLSQDEPLFSLGSLDLSSSAVAVPVDLYDSSNTLLASATVPVLGTSLDYDNFDYTSLITLSNGFNGTLVAGTTYYVVEDASANQYTNYASTTVSPIVTVGESAYDTGGFDSHRAGGVPGLGFGGPSFQFGTLVTTPEPSTWALALVGFVAIGFALRRSRA